MLIPRQNSFELQKRACQQTQFLIDQNNNGCHQTQCLVDQNNNDRNNQSSFSELVK